MLSLVALIAGGFMLGLAGALHCACMCGGVSSGALMLIDPRSRAGRLAFLARMQVGRVAVYAALGGLAAGVASFALDPLSPTVGFKVLQWAGAVALMWIGFSTAGMMPQPAGLGGNFASIGPRIDRALAPLRRHPGLAPYALGATWGVTPCPLVLAALLSATLSGSVASGIVFMAGFGLGTVPAVIGAAWGLGALSRTKWRGGIEIAIGLAIAALGFASLYFNISPLGLFCARP